MSDTYDIFANTSIDVWVNLLDELVERKGVRGMEAFRNVVRDVMDGTDEAYNTVVEVWEAREDALEGCFGGCGVDGCPTA